jgi:hypothetical protein
MVSTNVNIVIQQTGAGAAAAALNDVSAGMGGIATKHRELGGLFQQRLQHMGLMMFARDAITANGLGREARMVINLLNQGLTQGALAFGAAGMAVMPYIVGLTVLIGVLATVINKHRESITELNKHIKSNDELASSYSASLKVMDDYVANGGKMTKFLSGYKKAQEEAKKATDETTKSIELQAIKAIEENIRKLQDQIREQRNLNDYAKTTIATAGSSMAATYGLANAYTQLGKNAIPGVTLQLKQAQAELLRHQGAVKALEMGYSSLDEMLKATTEDLKNSKPEWVSTNETIRDEARHSAYVLEHEFHQKVDTANKALADSMAKGIGDAFAKMIVEGKNFTESMKSLFKNLTEQIISDFIRIRIEMAFMRAATAGAGGGFPLPMAEGGSGVVTRPTLFLAGEAGPEYVNFRPLSKGGSGGGNVSTGNINVNVYGIQNPDAIAEEVGRKIVSRIRGMGEINFLRAT